MTTRHFVEGETKPVLATLYDGDGASRTAIDGTGLTLGLAVYDRTGASVPLAGKVSWSTAASGIAKYEPADTDLRAANSPYTARWSVTDTNSDVAYYPNHSAQPEKWLVGR
jgi:hypothetical protein